MARIRVLRRQVRRPQARAPAALAHERDDRRSQPQRLRAGRARGLHPRARAAPALDHRRVRMAEAVVRPGRYQRQARIVGARRRPARQHRRDERRIRRTVAAMVRYQHRVGAQVRAPATDQAALHDLADVAGQQQRRAALRAHPQHAARCVVEVGEPARRMQETEFHAVPMPRDAGQALRRAWWTPTGAQCEPIRRHPRRGPRDARGECGRDRTVAARMVVVAVAEHDRIQPPHAQRLQRRHHDVVAGVVSAGAGRPGVVEQGVGRGADQHRQALPHVDHRGRRVVARRQAALRPQQWQPQQRRQRLARDAARQQQPCGAGQRERHGEPRRFRQRPQRERAARHPGEAGPRQVERPRRQPPAPRAPPRMHGLQRRAGQRKRHDHQAPPRDRDDVRDGARQRRLPEQHHGQRQQAHGGDGLRTEEAVQVRAPAMLAGAGQAPQQPRHAAEAEPEARRQHRQRIGQQHRKQRERERIGGALCAAQQPRQHHQADHQHRAHRRQREARHRGVAERTGEGGGRGGMRARQEVAERGPQPPGGGHEQRDRAGREPDVEAGDRDQVGQPGGAQRGPVGIVQAARVAERERAHETRRRRVDRGRDPARHAIAPRIDAPGRRQRPRACIGADVTGGGDAVGERAHLRVVAARVAQAARRAHAQRQAPTRARRQRRWMRRGAAVQVPAQLQQPAAEGRRRAAAIAVVDAEAEAQPPGLDARQFDHRAGDGDVGAFQRWRQAQSKRRRGLQPRERKTAGEHAREPQAPAEGPQQQPAREPGRQQPDRRQRRRVQAGEAAGEQCRACRQAERRKGVAHRHGSSGRGRGRGRIHVPASGREARPAIGILLTRASV